MAKFLSIEIGNKNIKIIEGRRKGSAVLVKKSAIIKTPFESVKEGNIENLNDLVKAISVGLKNNQIRTKKAIFNINSNSIISRNLDLPVLKTKDETISMIKYELEQYMPVVLNEYNILYKILETYEKDGVKKGKYTIYALPIKLFNNYLNLAKKLGLKLVSLDLSFTGLEKIITAKTIVNNYTIKEKDTVLLINLGHSNIIFNVIKNGVNDFSRVINFGGNDIDNSFADYYDIDNESASDLKHSLPDFNRIEEDNSEVVKKEMILNTVDNWVNEIRRLIQYYTSRNNDLNISKIYIYGGSSKINGIDKYLSKQLDLNFEILKDISTIKKNKKIRKFDIVMFLNSAAGLYFDKKDINFLSDKIRSRNKKFNKFVITTFFVLLSLSAGVLYFYQYFIQVNSIKKEIEAINKQLLLKKNIESVNEVNKMMDTVNILKQYRDIVLYISVTLEKEDLIKTEVLDDIASVVPIDTTINSMMIDGKAIQLQGESYSRESVAQFEKNLKNLDFIDNVYIPALTQNDENEVIYAFSAICYIKDVNIYEIE